MLNIARVPSVKSPAKDTDTACEVGDCVTEGSDDALSDTLNHTLRLIDEQASRIKTTISICEMSLKQAIAQES